MNKSIQYLWLFVISISTLYAASEEDVIAPKSSFDIEKTKELRKTIAKANKLLTKDSSKLRFFAQLTDKEKSLKAGYDVQSEIVVMVKDSNSWPENTMTSYIVLLSPKNTIVALHHVPSSESGDWLNTYTHYYDEKGKTIAFQRYSSFFNGCPDSPSNETSTYYFDSNKLISKDYALISENNKINSNSCDFMYRHDYKIYKSWPESIMGTGIVQSWQH